MFKNMQETVAHTSQSWDHEYNTPLSRTGGLQGEVVDRKLYKYSKNSLLRPPLVLSQSGLNSEVV